MPPGQLNGSSNRFQVVRAENSSSQLNEETNVLIREEEAPERKLDVETRARCLPSGQSLMACF